MKGPQEIKRGKYSSVGFLQTQLIQHLMKYTSVICEVFHVCLTNFGVELLVDFEALGVIKFLTTIREMDIQVETRVVYHWSRKHLIWKL